MNLLRNKYKILHSSLIIGFIAILLILLLEIGARVIYSEEDSGYCYTEHDVLYYIPKKYCQKKAKAFEGKTYTRSFNECGYISKHSCKEKLPGTFRIVGLGDSNTEGYGVSDDETYLAVLEGALQSRVKNAKIETFNLGVCGYDLPQYMQSKH
jgi:hypothetical protein